MFELYESFSSPEKTFFWIGAITSVFFIIQFTLSFIGGEIEIDDLDVSLEYEILTLKNVTHFLVVFGWLGLICLQNDVPLFLSILAGIAGGLAMVFIMSFIFYFMHQMKHDGTLKVENCVGKTGTVYLKIPENGSGKVNLVVQGASREFEAISKGNKMIPTGAFIKVVEANGETLTVEMA